MARFAVTDPSDPRLSPYANLTDVALRRHLEAERGLYMAEGFKVIDRAIRAGHRPLSFLTAERWAAGITEIAGDVDVLVAPDALVKQVTGYDVHRGALAAMHRPALPTLADLVRGARRIIILEGIVDHTNVGAIFRSVAALGADAVVCAPTCADPLYRRSVKVSMGTVFQVPWTRVEEWPAALDELREVGFVVAGLALADDAVALGDYAASLAPDARVAILLGAEGDGLTKRALSAVDTVVTIPMAGGVDSLNVAAASAVAMWSLRVE
jgi:tRNA G18 (ribose-2'-O)-methylase SpoU